MEHYPQDVQVLCDPAEPCAEPSTPRPVVKRRLTRRFPRPDPEDKENVPGVENTPAKTSATEAHHDPPEPEPSTPRRNVRPRLARRLRRLDSDEKENRPGLESAPATRCGAEAAELPQKRSTAGRQAAVLALPAQYPLMARERECAQLDAFIDRCTAAGLRGTGGCLYVSGGPGTGKTCSVRAAAATRQHNRPGTRVIEVNCMELHPRTAAGLFRRLEEAAQVGERAASGTAAAAAEALARLGSEVIVIVDEVDQLVGTSARCRAAGAKALEGLCSLPLLPGAPGLALVAIANAVGLFSRVPMLAGLCESLLFQPYDAGQLRKIAASRLTGAAGAPQAPPAPGSAGQGPATAGAAGALGLGSLAMELRLRQVAKRSGDCRQVMHLCESAALEAQAARDEAALDEPPADGEGKASSSSSAAPPPRRDPPRPGSDPLASVQSLPLEQQVLLCSLSCAQSEAVRIPEVCARYKALCQRLHQPLHLAKEQVREALVALEQRGLLSLRTPPGRSGRGVARAASPAPGDCIVELAVARAEVRDRICRASPMLERCMQ